MLLILMLMLLMVHCLCFAVITLFDWSGPEHPIFDWIPDGKARAIGPCPPAYYHMFPRFIQSINLYWNIWIIFTLLNDRQMNNSMQQTFVSYTAFTSFFLKKICLDFFLLFLTLKDTFPFLFHNIIWFLIDTNVDKLQLNLILNFNPY